MSDGKIAAIFLGVGALLVGLLVWAALGIDGGTSDTEVVCYVIGNACYR